MKKLILSADDFGRSHERNLAIDYCFRKGFISSAALLVNSRFTSDALDMALDGGYIDRLHCHINFHPGEVSGFSKPLTQDYKDCSMLSKNGDFKVLYKVSPFKCSKKILSIVENEMTTQYTLFDRLTNSQGCLTHIDFHLYCNLLWPVAGALKTFSKKHNIKTMRFIGGRRNSPSSYMSKIKQKILLYISEYEKVRAIPSYQADQFINIKGNLDAEVIEIYVHPDCINEMVVDNTKSALGANMITMDETFQRVSDINSNIISWKMIE